MTKSVVDSKLTASGGFAAFAEFCLQLKKYDLGPDIRGRTNIKKFLRQGIKIAKRPYKQGTYTKQEIVALRSQYPATSAVILASKLKRSLISVQRQLRILGIGRRKPKNWTTSQLQQLRTNYKTTAIWELANNLDKTPSEIKRKAALMALKK